MRDVFDAFIDVSPSTQVDIDAIARRSRMIRRWRRGAAVCATGLAVVGVAALAVAVAPGPHAAPSPASTLSTGTPSPRAAEPERLLTALRVAIAREAPQVTGLENLERYVYRCAISGARSRLERVPARTNPTPSPCPPPPSKRPIDVSRDYLWQGRLHSPAGTYDVIVHVSPSSYLDPAAPPVNQADTEERRAAAAQGEMPRRGPNGESILVGDALLNMTKPDGTGIMIQTYDVNHVGAWANRSPFTAEQLVAIGLDPALHL